MSSDADTSTNTSARPSRRPHACRWPLLAAASRCSRALARPAAASTSAVVDVRGPLATWSAPARTSASTTLDEIKALGADTLRIEVKWSEVAPDPAPRHEAELRRHRPRPPTRASSPTTTWCSGRPRWASAIMITLAPDAPRWATGGGRGGNYKVSSTDFAALRARGRHALLGRLRAACPRCAYWSIWNEPNHIFFIKPRSQAPRVYRRHGRARAAGAARDGARGLQDLRRRAGAGRHRDQGDRPAALPARVAVPRQQLQAAARLGRRARPAATASRRSARTASRTTPTGRPARRRRSATSSTCSAIRRLATALDQAARAGRITSGLPIYNTEFGFQTNPPDPFVSHRPRRGRREILNEKEEFSYRYSRLKSYSQYLLYDDPARTRLVGAAVGGLPDRPAVPQRRARSRPTTPTSYPIVVRRRGSGVYVWGRVRPGTGIRFVQLQRRSGRRFVNDGARSRPTPAATSRSTRVEARHLPLPGRHAGSAARVRRHQPRGRADQVGRA